MSRGVRVGAAIGFHLDGFDKRVLRAGLRLAGVLAAGTGLSVAARGTKAIPGGGPVPPSVDNVLRFYAVWWAGALAGPGVGMASIFTP
ncbi:hypothetical protein ACIBQX_45275 [Nonomuraea sp. NPDC049714]|uniref:hypothetical protein n=1 Tax=Nonomuraea sp. NPDC049714 TaxID=3364357 RepID=UPI0037AA11B6